MSLRIQRGGRTLLYGKNCKRVLFTAHPHPNDMKRTLYVRQTLHSKSARSSAPRLLSTPIEQQLGNASFYTLESTTTTNCAYSIFYTQ